MSRLGSLAISSFTRLPSRQAHPERSRLPRGHHHPAAPSPARELAMEDIRFHQLTCARDIEPVLHLRRELSLSVADEATFAALEKKETKPALSVLSSGKDNSSARSASFRSAWASRLAKRSSTVHRWTRRCCGAPGK